MAVYPLKFSPIFKERIWGGEKLKTKLQKPGASVGIGESWEISTVPGSISTVSNGALKGQSLLQLIKSYGAALIGDQVFNDFGTDFPILIKFIDADQDLSIQVHPNNSLAMERHGCMGKTEMWYVMEADPGSSLIVGFTPGIDQESYIEHLDREHLVNILERHSVTKGDAFFIETGTVHAIGAGVMLAEIQQTSDITYRVFDFNRKDLAGNLRELHTEQALGALSFTHKENYKSIYKTTTNLANEMVSSPYFKTNYLPIQGTYKDSSILRGSFKIYICVQGAGLISNEFGSEPISYGETVLMAAQSGFIEINSPKGAVFLEVCY